MTDPGFKIETYQKIERINVPANLLQKAQPYAGGPINNNLQAAFDQAFKEAGGISFDMSIAEKI